MLAGVDPVVVWDVETGREVASLPADVIGAGFLPGEDELIVMLGGDDPGWGFLSLLAGEPTDVTPVDEPLVSMALNPERTKVALGSFANVLVYDLVSRGEFSTFL
jgi:hypothetical protein